MQDKTEFHEISLFDAICCCCSLLKKLKIEFVEKLKVYIQNHGLRTTRIILH